MTTMQTRFCLWFKGASVSWTNSSLDGHRLVQTPSQSRRYACHLLESGSLHLQRLPPSPGSTKKLGQIQSTVPPDATLPQRQDHTAIPLIVPRLRGDWEELSEGEEGCEKDGGPGMETENRKSLFPDLDVPTEGSVPPPSLVHEGKKCKQREMLATAQTEQQKDGENTTQFARSGDDAAATTTATQDRIGAAAERKEERRRKLEQRKRRSWKHLLMEDENCDSLFLEINLHDALDTHTDSTTEAQLELHRD